MMLVGFRRVVMKGFDEFIRVDLEAIDISKAIETRNENHSFYGELT